MARFLFATMPAVGHTLPAIPIARTLVECGHRVRWYGGIAFADRIRATGADFHPITDARFDYSEPAAGSAGPATGCSTWPSAGRSTGR